MPPVRKYPCIDRSNMGRQNVDLSKNLKAAFLVKKIWNSTRFPILSVAFLDGNPQQHAWVKKVVMENTQPLMDNIRFEWLPYGDSRTADAHIRISFARRGEAWSVVGTDALTVPRGEPTMNLGWIDDETDFDSTEFKSTGSVVLHEMTHALGAIHEHQNPRGTPIQWNRNAVIQALSGPPNNWDSDTINTNMFGVYGDLETCNRAIQADDKPSIDKFCSPDTLTNGSDFDPDSIMLYWFPEAWVMPNTPSTHANKAYSAKDKEWLRYYYSSKSKMVEKFIFQQPPAEFSVSVAIWIMLVVFVFWGVAQSLRRKRRFF